MRYLILGAGPAGVTAAETLRKADPAGEVTLLVGEAGPPYARMAIPYVLRGDIGEEGTFLRKEADHFARLGVTLRHGRVVCVDPAGHLVGLEDGTSLPYDRLLVATGARPVKPPIAGLDLPDVVHCWTLDDVRAIAAKAREGARVVLIGAGFIGCIILEALFERGVRLSVVEAGDRMVPRMLDATAGSLLRAWCAAKGVQVFTSTKVTQIDADRAGLAVQLSEGRDLGADLVVVAAGVAPNVDFLAGSGVEIDQGILVDDSLRSSVAGIWAAGDVAQGRDFSTGGRSVQAIQPTAVDHGRIAALDMADGGGSHEGSLAMNVLDTMGLISCSFGAWDGVEGGDMAESLDAAGFRYIRLQFDGDVLVGAQSVGRTDHVGVLRGLITARVRLGDWKERLMADPHRVMDAFVALTCAA